MKNKIISFILALVFTASALTFPVSADTDELRYEIDMIMSYIYSTQGYGSINEYLSSGEVSDWHAFSFARYDSSQDFSKYREQVLQISTGGAVDRQRRGLALLFAGYAEDGFYTAALDETVGQAGIMSYVFGLHLLTAGAPSELHTVDSVIENILKMRLSDGGWAVSGNISNVDVTAMAVQALAPHRDSPDVADAVDSAVKYLSSVQLDGGGFINYGVENAESTAQVIVMLASLGKDPLTDTDFIKDRNLIASLDSFAVGNGGYSHTAEGDENKMATIQALYAKIALLRFYEGKSPLYVIEKSVPEAPKDTSAPVTETESVPETENNKTDENGADHSKKTSYKPIALIISAAVFAVIAAVLFISGKRNYKNFILLGVIFAAVTAFIIFVDISAPDDYYGSISEKENLIGEVTLSVDARAVKELDQKGIIPENGMILEKITLPLAEGDSVYDITKEAARLHGLNLETAVGEAYVRGIGFVYEFDFGPLAGWTYTVNGKTHSVGCENYTLSDGDRIVWIYTLEPTVFE